MRRPGQGQLFHVSKQITIQIPYLAVARFSGPDAGPFLQAQLSADIAALRVGETTFACYCSARGQVLGLLLVLRNEDEFLVAAAANLLPALLQRLRMFVLRARVEFSIAPELKVYGVAGRRYRISAEELCGSSDLGEWKKQELSNGVTWLGPETSEKFIPQILGFDEIGAVSFSKGCYPGQEIIARTKYLGKVKRKPLLLSVDGKFDVTPGARLRLLSRGEWSEGTLVDCSQPGGQDNTLLFVLATAKNSDPVEQLEIENQTYRCATM